MVKESIPGQMVNHTTEAGKTISSTVKQSSLMLKENPKQEFGKMGKGLNGLNLDEFKFSKK